MKAIILSAGQGSRLRPLTNDRPKGMVNIRGESIIERQVRAYKKFDISNITKPLSTSKPAANTSV